MKILFVGDVVGSVGRRTLRALLPELRERHAPDFVVVNGENAAGGVGITPRVADELFAQGADAITLGRFGADDLLVETKPDMTPVTEADTAAQHHMSKCCWW